MNRADLKQPPEKSQPVTRTRAATISQDGY